MLESSRKLLKDLRTFDKKWTKLVLICPCFVLRSIQLNICSDRVAGDLIVIGWRRKCVELCLNCVLFQ